MPEALLERLMAARNFNQGFATVEYLASAFVDIDLHRRDGAERPRRRRPSRREALARIGMPREIVMRHRTPHFPHVFSGDGYSAGYYSYLWSEVLDADAFDAFEEAGDVFDPRHGGQAESRSSTRPATCATRPRPIRAFRGRLPTPAERFWPSADWWRWWKTLEVNWRASNRPVTPSRS